MLILNLYKIFSIFIFCVTINEVFGESTKRPHVIFFLADDLGWDDVGFHGNEEISTPNIDALAYSGVILNNYYVQPLCSPSRSALLTGMYHIHTGMQHSVIHSLEPHGVPLNFTLLPQHFKTLGYTSRIVGKWHLGFFRKEYTPTYRGFDSHYGYWSGRIDYYNHTFVQNETVQGYDLRRNMDVDYDGIGTYATDLFSEESIKIISDHNDSNPLFLYVAHLAPHVGNAEVPLEAPAEVIQKFSHIKNEKMRIFAAMLWKLDESVGKIVEALKMNNMLSDSIIVFSTDNGGSAGGYEDSAASNWPLRGTKNSMWEGGVRGSAFVWSPLIKNPGRVSTQMMHITDWLPTLFHAVGGQVSDLPQMDGMNVWNSIQGESASPRKEILINIDPYFNGASIRVNEWKLLFNPSYIEERYDGWFGQRGRHTFRNERFRERLTNLKNTQNSVTGKIVKNLMPTTFDKIHTIKNDAKVFCVQKTKEAAFACNSSSTPCLFNILSDPCEYSDVSQLYSSIVNDLLEKLQQYNSSAVPPGNKPSDSRGNPIFWNNVWTNWFDFSF